MITKQVVVDQIEATVGHIIQIRLKKNIVEDGRVISSAYHRTVLEPGTPLASQMDGVNEHLAQMGWPAIKDISRIEAIVKAEHTPEVVKAWIKASSKKGK